MLEALRIVAVLTVIIAVAEWVSRQRWGRVLGGAGATALLITMVCVNTGLIPTATNAPIYDGLMAVVGPCAIFLLLLDVRLAALARAGAPMLIAFALGALGTTLGVFAALQLTGAEAAFGESAPALGGMFTGTYIGGSINFNALALHYEITQQGALFAGAVAADNIMTAVWMAVTLALPWLLRPLYGPPRAAAAAARAEDGAQPPMDVAGIALTAALTFVSLWAAQASAAWLDARGVAVPAILIITTLALIIAQTPLRRRLGGATVLGAYAVCLFLALIGAYADIAALMQLGRIAGVLIAFVAIVVAVHGAVLIGLGRLLRFDSHVVAIASTANIGGATTAAALAESFERRDLLLPGVAVGMLGNAVGTYAGFAVAAMLGA